MRTRFRFMSGLIVLCVTIIADTAWAQVLSGADRADFIAGTTASCVRGRDNDPDMQAMPLPYFKRWCDCYAGGLADRASITDLKANNQRVLAPLISDVSKTCYAAIKAAAMQELQNRR